MARVIWRSVGRLIWGVLVLPTVILTSATPAQGRGSGVSIEIVLSGAFRSDAPLEIAVTTVSNEEGDLYVVAHPGESPCGASLPRELDPWPDALTMGLVEDGVPVGTSTARRTFRPLPGRWRVCAYVDNLTGTSYIGQGTTTFTVRDAAAPEVRALSSAGKAGSQVWLRYEAYDDSRGSRERITVRFRGRPLAEIRTKFTQRLYRSTVVARWRSPRLRRGSLRFCVTATDRSGNRSQPSCAPIVLTR